MQNSFLNDIWGLFLIPCIITKQQILNHIFLTFDDGARLEIMNKPVMDDFEKSMDRTGFIHIAFSVGSKEKVDLLTEQLKKDGYTVVSGPRTTGDGYYESCIVAVEGNQIELTV